MCYNHVIKKGDNMITANCKICGKIFTASRDTQKHCSRKCFGISHKNHTPWNKGIKRPTFSKEWRENMSKASKGKKKKPFTKEHKRNIGLSRKGKQHSEETRQQMRDHSYYKGKFQNNHPGWRGGKSAHSDGYIYVSCPGHPHALKLGHYVLEHRLVMEKHICRYLDPKEVVHHINGIRNDNRIENLMLFANGTLHHAFHVSQGTQETLK